MQYYIDAIKKYVTFSGRATRKEYWMFILFNVLITFAIYIVSLLMLKATNSVAFGFLPLVYGMFIILPSISIAVRRMQDINKSGVWILVNFIPFVGGIWFIVLMATDTVNEGNNY